jgi:hypothetical protein
MATEYGNVFGLLDGYSRSHHQHFLAEMFLNKAISEWILCFRPIGAPRYSPARYACRNLRIPTEEAAVLAGANALSSSIVARLDKELRPGQQSG